MGIFTARSRRRPHVVVASSTVSTTEPPGPRFPPGFEAVGEALEAEACPIAASETVGREMASDGASVDEALSGLQATWQLVTGTDPSFSAVTALATGWGDVTLSFLHQLSCDDPLTGLASLAHLRTVLSGVFRSQTRVARSPRDTHALVVIDLRLENRTPVGTGDPIGSALRAATVAESARTVFGGAEVIARLTRHRVAVLATRDPRLGVRVRLLRHLLESMELDGYRPWIWIEGLPASDPAAGQLLDELARA